MIRRWVFRGLALLLLTLCVAAWVGSYLQSGLVYYEQGERVYIVVVEYGWGRFHISPIVPPSGGEWHWDHGPIDRRFIRSIYEQMDYRLAGFAYQAERPPYSHLGVFVPLWSPALLSSLLLWLTWRKTRAKPVGSAFPVEVTTVNQKAALK